MSLDPWARSMIGIGLIGIGGFAASHLSAIVGCGERELAKLEAVVIRNPAKYPERVEQLRREGVRVYSTPAGMFKDEKGRIELVGNPTAIAHHSHLSIKAMQSGYHVLCEKPVAGTLAEGLNMWEIQRETGKILAIFFQHLYTPAIQRIKAIALEKRLGQLVQCKTRVLWPRGLDYYERNSWAGKLSADGRFVYDSPAQNAADHFLQNMLYVAGGSKHASAVPAQVYGENYRANSIESADTQFLRITTENDCSILFIATTATIVEHHPVTEFLFEDGKIVWHFDGSTRVFEKSGDRYRCVEEFDNGNAIVNNLPYINTIESIRDGTTPICTIDNAIQHTMCIDRLFGEPERIKTIPEGCLNNYDSYFMYGKRIDHPILSIENIETITAEMFEHGWSFAESGVSWG